MGNVIKNMSKEKRDELKQKFEEADDSHEIQRSCLSHTWRIDYVVPHQCVEIKLSLFTRFITIGSDMYLSGMPPQSGFHMLDIIKLNLKNV
jgi:hypothetical protein